VSELVTVELGMMLQNLGLACEALGIGGFPNFATVDAGWLEGLGFRTLRMPTSRFLGVALPVRTALRLKRQDVVIRYPIGLVAGQGSDGSEQAAEVTGPAQVRHSSAKGSMDTKLSRSPEVW